MRTDHLNHTPDEAGVNRIHQLRSWIIQLEELIDVLVPESREKSIAKTKLEETRMWAIKGVVMAYPPEDIHPPL